MSLNERYHKEIVPQLMRDLGMPNRMAVPRVLKVVVNVGMGQAQRDPKIAETVTASLARITGQRAVRTLARQSIASFKIRKGMPVGAMVTLHGKHMWDFVEKLVRVTLPRVRDFRGLSPTTVDRQGNCSIGFREHVVFPEIRSDEVEQIHGLQVTIVSNAATRERGLALFRALGFPFHEEQGKVKKEKKEKGAARRS
ncbi:50S ribosomal protein L5 [Candidatus Uhrbacteria bacterium]|nr:50S ribosomal protein L5 [Candidatus Uhrbacteria bacterium]